MDLGMGLLRLVHVGCGAFWCGAARALAGFVEPAAGALGAEGDRFRPRLTGGQLPAVMAGLLAFGVGILFLRPAAESARLAAAPSEDERRRDREKALRRFSLANAALLLLAVGAMAIARYLP
jgi:putative copper export protein